MISSRATLADRRLMKEKHLLFVNRLLCVCMSASARTKKKMLLLLWCELDKD